MYPTRMGYKNDSMIISIVPLSSIIQIKENMGFVNWVDVQSIYVSITFKYDYVNIMLSYS